MLGMGALVCHSSYAEGTGRSGEERGWPQAKGMPPYLKITKVNNRLHILLKW
jgi:hypothetical protein